MIKNLNTYSKFKKYAVDPPLKLEGSFLSSAAVKGVWMEGPRPQHFHHMWTMFKACDNATHLALQLSFFHWLVHSSLPLVDLWEGEKRASRCALACNQDIHSIILDA
jgi:hypothetical protein